MIKSTKIGLCVNNIKKKYDGEIGKLARELVHHWKSIYQSSQATGENPSPSKGKKPSAPSAGDGGETATAAGGGDNNTPTTASEVSEQSTPTTSHSPRPDSTSSDGIFGKLELDSLPEGRRNVSYQFLHFSSEL